MQNELYQVVTPAAPQSPSQGESMTFNTNLERKQFIALERAKNWEVILSFRGMVGNKELYAVARRAL